LTEKEAQGEENGWREPHLSTAHCKVSKTCNKRLSLLNSYVDPAGIAVLPARRQNECHRLFRREGKGLEKRKIKVRRACDQGEQKVRSLAESNKLRTKRGKRRRRAEGPAMQSTSSKR